MSASNNGGKAPSNADLLARLEALEAENATLKRQAVNGIRTLTPKPSKSGSLSLYGIGRFPTTLYPAQWEAIIDNADLIRTAIEVGTEMDAFATKGGQKISRDEDELEAIRIVFADKLAKAQAEAV